MSSKLSSLTEVTTPLDATEQFYVVQSGVSKKMTGTKSIKSSTGTVTFEDTTVSSSETTGALVVKGGVGLAGELYTGGAMHVGGGGNDSLVNVDQSTGFFYIYLKNFYSISMQAVDASSVVGFKAIIRDGGGSVVTSEGAWTLSNSGMTFTSPADNQPIGFYTNLSNSPTLRFEVKATYNNSLNGLARGIATKTADFSVADTDSWLINNKAAATCTVTLPTASSYTGREIMIKTIQAFTVVSASSNVVPKTGGAAGTAILPATSGAWATLVSDGTNWQIFASGT
jgi:hypothetical protein